MQVLPIDVTAVVAVVMGISLLLIPVIGLTARFALKPTVEALSRLFEGRGRDESLRILERRIALLEQQFDVVEGGLRRVEEVVDFDARLRGPGTGQGPEGVVRIPGSPPSLPPG